jgi:hypothetical protein
MPHSPAFGNISTREHCDTALRHHRWACVVRFGRILTIQQWPASELFASKVPRVLGKATTYGREMRE